MLKVEEIEVRYGKTPAVRGISLDVEHREMVCLVGPNGAGKSTTLKAIMGELALEQGVIKFEDQDLRGDSVENIVRRGLSMVPEGRRIFSRLTVEENLKLATFGISDRGGDSDALGSVYNHFPILKERRWQPAGRLSGGEQQQLAIARALLTRPRLLMVDEPALGLAPLVVEHIYTLLRHLCEQGMPVLVVEQSLERALDFSDRLYVIRAGRVQLSGATPELKDDMGLHAAYFGFHRDPPSDED